MKRKLVMMLTCLVLSVSFVLAQTKTITGTVFSEEDGAPVVGASVLVEGTTIGTITDIDGNFTLNRVPASAKQLKVSFIGLETAYVQIKDQMQIYLKSDVELLDEVMVVAFGTAKKSAFTGSAGVLDNDKIAQRQTSNVANALAGQVAGVQLTSKTGEPGKSPEIRIRGIGSISAGNTPLYVVDGVPYDGEIAAINSQDIESMTVLKDAASNALYGARGANGVVLITTKKGEIGSAKITVDAKWGTNRRGVPNYDVIKSPAEYYELEYQSLYNYGVTNPPSDGRTPHQFANANLLGRLGYLVYTLPDNEYLIGENGKLNPNATLGYSDGHNYFIPDDWYDEIFDSGNLRQEYNINISGANDKVNYYISAGYLDDSGIIPNSGYTRFSTRLKLDYQAKDWLRIGANMSYVNSDSQSPRDQEGSSSGNLFYVTNLMAPIYPLYLRDAEGSIMKDRHGHTMYDYGEGAVVDAVRPFMNMSNPASMIELDKQNYKSNIFSGKWYANINFLPELRLTYNLGFDVDDTRYTSKYNAYYGQYASVGGVIYVGSMRDVGITQQVLLNYNKSFGSHSLEGLLGFESYDLKRQDLIGSKQKLYNPEISEIDNAINSPTANSSTNRYATQGFLTRVQYDYEGKYFGSVSYRRDGSSRFHKDNRWGNFWSVGGGWLMNKESFLEEASWIDMLKFKISYGVQGNDRMLYRGTDPSQNYYPYADQYQVSNNADDFAVLMYYKGNKDLTWETSHSFNTGFDFTFFKGRLDGSIEYFSRKTTDLLYYKPVAPSLGYSHLPMNVGSMYNRGLELGFNGVAVQSNNVDLSFNFNMTYFKNKINKLDKSLNGELIDGSRIYREGESLYQLYLRNYAGINDEGVALYYRNVLDDDKQVVLDENGQIMRETTTDWNTATRYGTGDILPKVYGGFGANLQVYDFDFSISFAYQLGGKIYDNTYASLMHSGGANTLGTNWHKDIRKAWKPDGVYTDVPRLHFSDSHTNKLSDRFLTNSNYLNLQNISLGYNVPKSLLRKIDISALRIYVVADNVALFSKRKGLDPRQSYTSSANSNYSPIRTISGGITLSF
ncbi:MAG: TonB-dependent receptor [Bacteroidales bacterium]|nr:TonB-dependent receptor [Bacteroidales bacterium]